MDYRLLGPLEVRSRNGPAALGGPRQRAILAVLLLRANELVPRELLIDAVWGERPPATASAYVHNCVSRLRRELDPEVLETRGPSYVLHAVDEEIDARRFERALEGSRLLEASERTAALNEALSLWRGAALADFAYESFAFADVVRLEELRLIALEERIEAELELGHHARLIAEIDALVARHPLRERLRSAQLLALYRARRKPEALKAFQDTRLALIDELGIEPSAELRELERRIHRDDPELELAQAGPAMGRPVEVRRPAVVLCAEPDLGGEEDPEAAAHRLETSVEAVRAAVERHGGTMQQLLGDELIAFFGLPSAHEDDALRALRAATELRDELADLGTPARVGLSAGEVVASGAASPQAGPAVRMGRRLKDRAAPGSILLGSSVARLAGAAVDTVPADGTGDAFRLLRLEPDAAARATRFDSPFVGRSAELSELGRAFAWTVDHRACRRIVLAGDPGVGKTRLTREFTAALGDAAVVTGRCRAYGEAAQYLPLSELVRQTVDRGAPDLPPELVPLADGRAPTATNPSLFQAVRRHLATAFGGESMVVVLEDLHWGGSTLLDLVDYLAGSATEFPLLVLCVARPELFEERPGWRGDELALEPLAEAEARLLAAAQVPNATPERLQAVLGAAEGNPLFIEQLSAFDDAAQELPPSLEALLASRLDRLDQAHRALLGHAAVAGREFWRGGLEALAADEDREATAQRLAALVRRRFLRPVGSSLPGEDAFVFRHALLRDAAYASVPKASRADLHQRLAQWLERRPEAADEVIGFHLERAYRYAAELGRDEPSLAAEAAARLGTSGIAALKRNAFPATIDLLSRATALLPAADPARLDLGCELGTALKSTTDYRRVEDVLAEIADTASRTGDRRAELRARIELVWPQVLRGGIALDDALEFVEGALAELSADGDDRTLERAWLCLAALRGRLQFRHAASEEAATIALEHGRAPGFAQSSCLAMLANDACDGPRPVIEAIERCSELLSLAADDRVAEADIRRSLAGLLAMQADFAGARKELNATRAIVTEFGFRGSPDRDDTSTFAEVEWLAGNDAAAERRLRDACSALAAEPDPAWLATQSARLAELLAATGRAPEALSLAEQAAELVIAGDVRTEAAWRRARAHAGDADGEALAREAIDLLAPTDELTEQAKTLLALAAALRRERRQEEANEATDAGRHLLREKGNSALLARIL